MDLDLLQQRTRVVRLNAASPTASPATGKRWMVLSGIVTHITGTLTNLSARHRFSTVQRTYWGSYIPAAVDSDSYPLFPSGNPYDLTGAAVQPALQSAFVPVLLTDEDELYSAGGTGYYVTLKVIEF